MRCRICGGYIPWDLSLSGLCWPCGDAVEEVERAITVLELEPASISRPWQDIVPNPRYL